ncbi:MAG: ATP-binding protein, partial [Erysipelotrichaceae bacterium]|nr:ATP-binding protein [Erysipelotrichaceae bacterium]
NEKQIGIEAYIDLEKEFKMIISNTYNNQIDKNKIGKETFSTKGKTRGNGLLLVKHLVNNNKVFEIKTEIQENLYIQTIRIKK